MSATIYAMASSGQAGRAAAVSFFDDLVRCETRLYNALNERLRDRHGIVMSQFEFLYHLRIYPHARVGDIASTFAIGVGATSKATDRLEKLGWVQRLANPADRRSSLLVLTEAGERLLDQAQRTCEERLNELIDVGPEQLTAVANTLARIRRSLERDQIGTPIG
jgi:MarR family multiple antibiotic resistance transcriptional regulator